jgi:hypothetical protein
MIGQHVVFALLTAYKQLNFEFDMKKYVMEC